MPGDAYGVDMTDFHRERVLHEVVRKAISRRDIQLLTAALELGVGRLDQVRHGRRQITLTALIVDSGWVDAMILITDCWPRRLRLIEWQ